MRAKYLGFDLGATNAKAAVVDDQGKVLGFELVPLSENEGVHPSTLSPTVVVERLVLCADRALTKSDTAWTALDAVGLGTPGAIEGGVVLAAANLFDGHCPVPLQELATKAISMRRTARIPVVLVNDADAALLAELWTGSARNLDDVAMLTLGSGIGCSVAVGGRVLRGSSGTLEGGHMIVSAGPDARRCTCGSRGCLEAYASANSITSMYREAGGTEESCVAVFGKAAEGDQLALNIVDCATRHLAVGAINLIRTLDPSTVVLAGGVAAAGDTFLCQVRRAMDDLDWSCLPHRSDRLVLAAAGPHTGCIGAARAAQMYLG